MTDQAKTHPIDKLRENLALFNAQAEDLGAGLEGATAWRFASRLFHDVRRALEEVDAAGTDSEMDAVLATLVAGARLILVVDQCEDVHQEIAAAVGALSQTLSALGSAFGFDAEQIDEAEEGPDAEDDDNAEDQPLNGAAA